MTFPISPGVYDREIDASVVTIQAPGAPGAFVANLDWGPVLKRKVISSEEHLKQVYSRPFLQNNYDFLLASQFLSYSDNLLLTRVSSGNNSIGGRSLGPVGPTGCEGATPSIQILEEDGVLYSITIDSELIYYSAGEAGLRSYYDFPEIRDTLLYEYGIIVDQYGVITNIGNDVRTVKIVTIDMEGEDQNGGI